MLPGSPPWLPPQTTTALLAAANSLARSRILRDLHPGPFRHGFRCIVGRQDQVFEAFPGLPLSVRPILEAEHAALYKVAIVEVFLDQHVSDAQGQGRFRTRSHRHPLIGFGCRQRTTGFDLNDLGRSLAVAFLPPERISCFAF